MSTDSATARQWQRVDCHVPVQLQVRLGSASAASATKTVHAQAINMSEGGMQLRTADPLRVGDDVTCSLLLEGRHAALPGRVRWAKPTVPGVGVPGVGIQFERLSDDDSGLLRKLVTHAVRGEQPVDLYFASLKEPVHARAFTTDAGLHISAALPVLSRESEVEFRFAGQGPRFLGRVAAVAVRERSRTPHLEVQVAIEAREMPRFRRYTMYGAEDAAEAGDTATDTAAAQDAASPAHTPHASLEGAAAEPRRRGPTLQLWRAQAPAAPQPTAAEPAASAAPRAPANVESRASKPPETAWRYEPPAPASGLSQLGVLAAGVLLGAGLCWLALHPDAAARTRSRAHASLLAQRLFSAHLDERRDPQPPAQPPAPTVARVAEPSVGAPSAGRPSPSERSAEQPASLGAALATQPAPSPATATTPAAAPLAPSDPTAASPAPARTDAIATSPAAPAALADALATRPDPAPALTDAIAPSPDPAPPLADARPIITFDGSSTEIALPLVGSTDGLRTTVWAAPRALIVDLPSAQIPLAQPSYLIGDAGVRKLAVVTSGDSSVLRIYLDAPITKHAVRLEGSALHVRFERASAATKTR